MPSPIGMARAGRFDRYESRRAGSRQGFRSGAHDGRRLLTRHEPHAARYGTRGAAPWHEGQAARMLGDADVALPPRGDIQVGFTRVEIELFGDSTADSESARGLGMHSGPCAGGCSGGRTRPAFWGSSFDRFVATRRVDVCCPPPIIPLQATVVLDDLFVYLVQIVESRPADVGMSAFQRVRRQPAPQVQTRRLLTVDVQVPFLDVRSRGCDRWRTAMTSRARSPHANENMRLARGFH